VTNGNRRLLSGLLCAAWCFPATVFAQDVDASAIRENWNGPLNWHTRDGHTLRERKHQWREGSDIPGSFSARP
jgi:hypothetical protein